jgi:hypothetical protein
MGEPDDLLLTATSAVAAFAARPVYALTNDDLRSLLDRLQRLATGVAGTLAVIVQNRPDRPAPRRQRGVDCRVAA